MRSVFLLASVIVAASCSSGPEIQPESTGYPRDQVIQEDVQMWVAPGIKRESRYEILPREDGSAYASGQKQTTRTITFDFVKTRIGDSALKEIWIVPQRNVGSSENALLAALPSRATSECKGPFRAVQSTYFLGSEATVTMMGIEGRSLRALIRCSVYGGSPKVPNEEVLRSFGSRTPDLAFFDASSAIFPRESRQVVQAIETYVSKRGMVIVARANVGGTTLLHSGFGKGFGARDQDLYAISSIGDGTRVTLISPRFRPYIHTYSVFSNVPDRVLGIAPNDRDFAYKAATKVYGALGKLLEIPVSKP